MLHIGSRDVGFAGLDWVHELGIDDSVIELFDTKMDVVRIVAAAPNPHILSDPEQRPKDRPLIVASEYETLTKSWLAEKGIEVTN